MHAAAAQHSRPDFEGVESESNVVSRLIRVCVRFLLEIIFTERYNIARLNEPNENDIFPVARDFKLCFDELTLKLFLSRHSALVVF